MRIKYLSKCAITIGANVLKTNFSKIEQPWGCHCPFLIKTPRNFEDINPISFREAQRSDDHIISCHSKTPYYTTFKLGDF